MVQGENDTPDNRGGKAWKTAALVGLEAEEAEQFRVLIEEKLKVSGVKEVRFNPEVIKSGYICDINSYTIVFEDPSAEPANIVLKVSNFDNELSKTAVKLDLYFKEGLFYEKIRESVKSVSAPITYGVVRANGKIGILMEDLRKFDGIFNLPLVDNLELLHQMVRETFALHREFYFTDASQAAAALGDDVFGSLVLANGITYYQELVANRFEKFLAQNTDLPEADKQLIVNIHDNYAKIMDGLSTYPLSLCHGDVKSPNTFYRKGGGDTGYTPYFLDWQYIHLNKGVSDIAFLLIESVAFDEAIVGKAVELYWSLHKEAWPSAEYDEYMMDFKRSICSFAYFVMVWFNSEDKDKLVDSTFPVRFRNNLLKYYSHFIDDSFFAAL
jgi:thiamine kinase-like enzyme